MSNIDITSVSRTNTAKVAYRLLDRMQDFPAEEQVAAVAVLYYILSQELSLPPATLFNVAKKITRRENLFKDEQDKVFDALGDYVANEVSRA